MADMELERLIVRVLGDGSQYGKVLDQAIRETEAAAKKVEAVVKKVEATGSAVTRSLGDSVQSFGKNLAWAGVGLTAFMAPVTGLLYKSSAAAMKMQSLKLGLVAVAGSSEEAEKQLLKLRDVAKLPGLGLEEAIQGSISLQAVKLNADLANRAMKAFGNALATVGKGRHELQGVLLAITQIVAKGKVQAEEINQIAERMPQIREALKQAFGSADTQKLQKMGLTPQMFIEGIVKQFEKLPMVAGGAANTMENFKDTTFQAMTEVGNIVLEFVMPVVDSLAATVEGMTKKWMGLNDTSKKMVVGLGAVLSAVGPVLVSVGGGVLAVGKLTSSFIDLSVKMAESAAVCRSVTIAYYALSTVAIVTLLPVLYDLTPHMRMFNDEMERSKKLSSDLAQREKDRAQKILDVAAAMESVPSRKLFLGNQVQEAEKQSRGLEAVLHNAEAALERQKAKYGPDWSHPLSYMFGVDPPAIKAAKEDLTAARQVFEENQKFISEMKQKIEGAGTPEGAPVTEAYKSLGLPDLNALKKQQAAMKKAAEAHASHVKQVVGNIKEQIATFGMSEGHAKRYQIMMDSNLTPAEKRYALALQDKLNWMKKVEEASKKAREDAEERLKKADEETKKKREEATSRIDALTERYLTPVERLRNEMAQVMKDRDAGLFKGKPELFRRVMADYTKRFDELRKKADVQINFSYKGGAAFGTMEWYAEIQEHLRNIKSAAQSALTPEQQAAAERERQLAERGFAEAQAIARGGTAPKPVALTPEAWAASVRAGSAELEGWMKRAAIAAEEMARRSPIGIGVAGI